MDTGVRTPNEAKVRIHLYGVRGSTAAPGAEFLRHGGHTWYVAIAGDDGPSPALILDAAPACAR